MHFPIRRVSPGDPGIPPSIWQLDSPPSELYIQGSERAWALLERIPDHALAIVGTRSPQMRSLQLIARETARLRDSNLLIISGFALGVDRAAHVAALKTGLPTIAVLGAGHHIDYPAENAELRQQILDSDGLLISELSPDEHPHRLTFLRRNRLIAGWAKATWIVEAPQKSGALNTAYWSLRNGRDTYATSTFPDDPDLRGNYRLLIRDDPPTHAFYRAESLQMTWSNLVIRNLNSRTRIKTQTKSPNSCIEQLIFQFREKRRRYGAVHLDDLLAWWRTQAWPLSDFFLCLETAQKQGEIPKEQLLLYT